MKSRFALIPVLLLPLSAFAQAYSGECGTCVDRKQRMCADECERVPSEKSRRCQQMCIAEYCAHKCDKDAPEIQAYLKETCNDCLEQQYALCEVHCKEGTPRKRAVCQTDCSAERCKNVCDASSEPRKDEETTGE